MNSSAKSPMIPMLLAGVGVAMILGGSFKSGGPVVIVIGVLLACYGFFKIFRP